QKQRAVSDGEWKLIEYFVNDVRTTQLFNIVKDPKELNDLSGEKKYAKKITQLRKQMKVEADKTSDKVEFVQNL
ncbi:MAG: sulfatase/phosphatase domain-containing protein, partial [Rikenellaceae bacterium]